MRIAVLGVGLIGGSIGLAAREHVEEAEVVGFGRDPSRLRRAVELGAIGHAAGSLEEALEGAELCFACAPVGALPELVDAALAAAAAGADGVIVEVHPCPEDAVCDGPQALVADDFEVYLRKLEAAAELAGKTFEKV